MKRLIMTVVAGGLAVVAVRAQAAASADAVRADIARCAAVTDALHRLECYDRLARRLKLPPTPGSAATSSPGRAGPLHSAPAPASAPGSWQRSFKRDGKGHVVAVTVRLAAARQSGGVGSGHAVLVLKCADTETTAAIEWGNYAGSTSVPVTLTAGGGKAERTDWPVGTDGSSTRYPGSAVKLIRKLEGARTLTARLNPYGGYPVTAHFSLAGMTAAVAPLRRACRR